MKYLQHFLLSMIEQVSNITELRFNSSISVEVEGDVG